MFGNKIHSGQTSAEDALEEQSKTEKLLMSLQEYKPLTDYKVNAGKEFLKNAEDLLEIRNKIVNAFRDCTFRLAIKMCKKNRLKKQKLIGCIDQ